MNKYKMLYLCSITNAVLKPPHSLSMSLLVKRGEPPFDFKRVNGVYFSLFSTRFVREEACVIHP